MKIETVIVDPGHGMGNRERGVYDPGACAGGAQEASIAMDWANELRSILMAKSFKVIRTRRDAADPAPVSRRDDIATSYGGDIMISLHCNSGGGKASGAEVFYRGADDKEMAAKLSAAVARVLGIPDRGPKLEKDSQHKSLAVLEFDKCWLLEIGFIDHAGDRAKMLDPAIRKRACEAIASVILAAA
jgi:N-acetylmuramoyl-L-alanine amidase